MCCSVRCPQRSFMRRLDSCAEDSARYSTCAEPGSHACGDAGCSVSKLTRLAPHPLQAFPSPLVEGERTTVRGLGLTIHCAGRNPDPPPLPGGGEATGTRAQD